MYRVNVQGTVLALDAQGLTELLVEMAGTCGVIVPCRRGFVVDSTISSASIMVDVTPIPAEAFALVGAA